MSMSTSIVGIKPPDETWKKMKAIWDACKAVGIEPPEEVIDFFEDGEPEEKGQTVDIPCAEWKSEFAEGVEVEVAKIPKHVKILRFYNSW